MKRKEPRFARKTNLQGFPKHDEAALTTIQSVLAAFAIILIDLIGRAGLDKVLALAGGPAIVALWAQLQSVVELVSTVALAGGAKSGAGGWWSTGAGVKRATPHDKWLTLFRASRP